MTDFTRLKAGPQRWNSDQIACACRPLNATAAAFENGRVLLLRQNSPHGPMKGRRGDVV